MNERPRRERRRNEKIGEEFVQRHHSHEAYLGLMSCFAGGLILYGAARRRSHESDRPLSWSDLLLLGVATHKISRIIANDRVTLPFRAPFTRAEHALERGEPSHPVLQGVRQSIGELVTCPYCLAPWVSLTLHVTHWRFPQVSRSVGSIFAVASLSDFINRAYGRMERA